MKKSIQRVRIYAVITVLGIVMMPIGTLRAQESPKPASSATTIPSAQEEPKSEKAEGREKVKEGEEADAIRNAPAVKWIARHTGLTNDQAYWLCIGLNFAVIFFAIAGLLRKKLPGYFGGRTA